MLERVDVVDGENHAELETLLVLLARRKVWREEDSRRAINVGEEADDVLQLAGGHALEAEARLIDDLESDYDTHYESKIK